MRRIKASILYFVLVMGAGFFLGVIRVSAVVPRLGERYAELSEMPIMFLVIVLAARHIVQRFELARDLMVRAQVGFTALALSVTAELLLATMLQSRSITQYIASRDPVSGSVYVLLLLMFALMPALLAHVTGGDPRARHP